MFFLSVNVFGVELFIGNFCQKEISKFVNKFVHWTMWLRLLIAVPNFEPLVFVLVFHENVLFHESASYTVVP